MQFNQEGHFLNSKVKHSIQLDLKQKDRKTVQVWRISDDMHWRAGAVQLQLLEKRIKPRAAGR